MYKGWVSGSVSDVENDIVLLERLGVKILRQNTSGAITTYEVEMDEKVFHELNEYWGKFHWGLDQIKEGRKNENK